MESEENQKQVFLSFHRPWKSRKNRGISTFPTAPTAAGIFQSKSGILIVADRKECLTPDMIQAIQQLGGRDRGVNELSIVYACPKVHNVFSILKRLAASGVLRRVGPNAVELISVKPPSEPIQEPDKVARNDDDALQTRSAAAEGAKDVNSSTLENSATDVKQGLPKSRVIRIRKCRYRPLRGLWPDRERQLIARIADWFELNGVRKVDGTLEAAVRDLERGLHAKRYPEWDDAMARLRTRGILTIAGRRARFCPQDAMEDPYPIEPKPKKKRRKRPLSEWVKRKILERGGTIPEGRE